MDALVTRRRLLGATAAGIAAPAGCLDRPPQRTSRSVLVTNATDAEFTVTLRVYELPEGVTGDGGENGTATPTPGGEADDGETATPATATPEGPPTGELEQAVVRRETLAPEGSFAMSNQSLPGGDLRVSATTTAGQSGTLDWSRVDERSTLDVRVVDNGVQFTELD
ncbi:hypothetical protein BRD02_00560 [Halobacteriales archaeon QS_8_69_73]|nr:MAG: hypothetical protein BRD02_00560 [Halobacteriales archaeon QS_8_69_73]